MIEVQQLITNCAGDTLIQKLPTLEDEEVISVGLGLFNLSLQLPESLKQNMPVEHYLCLASIIRHAARVSKTSHKAVFSHSWEHGRQIRDNFVLAILNIYDFIDGLVESSPSFPEHLKVLYEINKDYISSLPQRPHLQ